MNILQRRCRSEHAPLPANRLVPPHKAAKLRQAQLREAQNHSPPVFDFSKQLTIRTGLENKNKDSSRDTILHPSVIPPIQRTKASKRNSRLSSAFINRDDRNEKQAQTDGTAHLPSIDTVISPSEARDERRQQGETEFYEQIGKDSVIRRRSMMRTVDKDDCLVGRGANPRTGLVTPDWNSVAGSLENDRAPVARRDRPSAQWRLEGDSWVNVPPESIALDDFTSRRQPSGKYPNLPLALSVSGPASRTISGDDLASALTESNLRTFSNQAQPQEQPPSLRPRVARPPNDITAIRRKPVGSPNPLPHTSPPGRNTARNASNDTVIHSPDAVVGRVATKDEVHQYYNADAVGRDSSPNDAASFPHRARNGTPFLGSLVEPRNFTVPQVRGFTNKTAYRDQLEESLRTNNGPYPSHPSSQRLRRNDGLHYRDQNRMLYEHYTPQIKHAQGPRNIHQQVPRACHPDDAISFKPAGLRDISSNVLQTRQWNRPILQHMRHPRKYHHRGILEDSERDQAVADTYRMNTDIHLPQSRRQLHQEDHPYQYDHTWSRHDTFRGPTHMIDHVAGELSDTLMGGGMPERILPSEIEIDKTSEPRPTIGHRSPAMLRIPKSGSHLTDMGSKVLSSTTGIKETRSDKENEGTGIVDIESEQQALEAISGFPRQVIKAEPTVLDTDGADTQSGNRTSVEIRDHLMCCPECCIDFNCHDGCLGHPSPSASVVDSETSSLVSMGVFDPKFETSVKAINKALLTPDKPSGKLAKIQSALGWGSGTHSPCRSSTKPDIIKRTLREESLSQKVNVGLKRIDRAAIQGPRECQAKLASAAAARALNPDGSLQQDAIDISKARTRAEAKIAVKKASNEERKKMPAQKSNSQRNANCPNKTLQKGRMPPKGLIGSSSESTLMEHDPHAGTKLDPTPAACELNRLGQTETFSMLDTVESFIRRKSTAVRAKQLSLNVLQNPLLLNYVQTMLLTFKEMTLTIAETSATIGAVAFGYNKTGRVKIPEGTSLSDLVGNLVRSVLYLMIAACIYGVLLKVGRMVLGVLRVVLLPIRVCAWIIG